MTDHDDIDSTDGDDPILSAAGSRLRSESSGMSAATVQAGALHRRSRHLGMLAGGALGAVAILGGLLLWQVAKDGGGDSGRPGRSSATASGPEVDRILADLDAQPVDPTKVKLVSTVSTFDNCEALIGDLRRVGAAHVGSRGFGGFDYGMYPMAGYAADGVATRSAANEMTADVGSKSASPQTTATASLPRTDETTLGTNVQVAGVDELDYVKAVGNLVFDINQKGELRITDVKAGTHLSTLDVTPGDSQVSQILVADGRVVLFGNETKISEPIEGDPSATQSSTPYMTVTFVDVSDPAKPSLTDRVRIEGDLVSARMVGGEIRLVTTSNMTDLGFVMPTTPNSVAKALEQNRRTVAGSTAADRIPDWNRKDEAPQPLVPCERVHVPDTFAGVAMTSMVSFPIGTGRFDPSGTSIVAPGDTLYAGLDTVAISSNVWVDPIDRDRLQFDDWQTAIHEFSFAPDTAPGYDGSGIIDGSTIGQFAFGEIGDSLAVVSSKGTPWGRDPQNSVDLTVFAKGKDGKLSQTSKLTDLAAGRGEVTAVRFVEGRVLISTGMFGRVVQVVDVTDPAAPRKAGAVTLPSATGYFHPLPDDRALVVGSRSDTVGTGDNKRDRQWVQVQLLDVADADAPAVVNTWERPWSSDNLAGDHHGFTYWPDRKLAMWGIQNTDWASNGQNPNHAVVLSTDGQVTEVALPEAHKPNEVPSPCPTVPVTDEEAKQMIGDGVLLRCTDKNQKEIEWPRYSCWNVDAETINRFSPGEGDVAAFFVCNKVGPPAVARVLVVSGKPILLTDQTLETLDPETFASTSILYHPGTQGGYPVY